MKRTRSTWRDTKAATLRARYAKLLRLREFVQRIEDEMSDHDWFFTAAERTRNLRKQSAPATFLDCAGYSPAL